MRQAWTFASSLLITVIGLHGGMLAFAQGTKENANAGNAIRGQKLYFEHGCYGCHGYSGAGRFPLSSDSPILVEKRTFMKFLRLRADRTPILPSINMPHYPESSLSNKETEDIYAFLRTFNDDTPSPNEIPALKAILEDTSRHTQ